MTLTARQWATRSVLAILLVLVLLVVLGRLYFVTLQREALAKHVAHAEQVAQRLESMLLTAQTHIRRLQQTAQFSLHSDEAPLHMSELLSHPEQAQSMEEFSLDEFQRAKPQAHIGNIFLQGNPRAKGVSRELRVIESLFPVAAAGHLADNALQWTYYSSFVSRLTSIYPFRDYKGLLADNEVDSLAMFYERYLPLETRREAIRELTPVQAPTWRRAHWDRAGAGWVVAISAPVRFRGEVVGAVSSDVKLSFLSQQLARESKTPERLILIDEQMNLLADSRSFSGVPTRLEHWLERLPVTVLEAARNVSGKTSGWVEGNSVYLYVRPIAHSPWQLVSVMPISDLFFEARTSLLWMTIAVLIVSLIFVLWIYRHVKIMAENETSWERPQ